MGRITVDERAERLIEFKDLQQRSEIPNPETQIVSDHLGLFIVQNFVRFRRGRDRMVVVFITTYVISACHH